MDTDNQEINSKTDEENSSWPRLPSFSFCFFWVSFTSMGQRVSLLFSLGNRNEQKKSSLLQRVIFCIGMKDGYSIDQIHQISD